MIRFNCDYSEGAHPAILKKLVETNMEQTPGYGEDHYCAHAAELILKECGNPKNALVRFIPGGTQTNLIVISAALRPHQGVIAAETGHVNIHESGAIEATGHKVLAQRDCVDGKLTAQQVQKVIDVHYGDETQVHMVQPKMVYISHPTEMGTLYTKKELEALYATCQKNDLYLFIDGARMGYGLTAPGTDLDLKDIAANCDVFYIGGTKVGALFGEALVVLNPTLQQDLLYIIKQKGAMFAKGRLMGLQFETLFENGLYYEMGRHANEAATLIREACIKKGLSFLCPSPTNQQFPILPNGMMKEFAEKYAYATMDRMDENHTAVRFCTSWATSMEDARTLAEDILNWQEK